MLDDNISSNAKAIYFQLKAFDFNNKGYAYPGRNRLTQLNSWKSNSTTDRAIKELIDKNILEKK